MALETAEELAYELDHCNSHSWSGPVFNRKEAAKLIEADRAAVRAALLDEMIALDESITGELTVREIVAMMRCELEAERVRLGKKER